MAKESNDQIAQLTISSISVAKHKKRTDHLVWSVSFFQREERRSSLFILYIPNNDYRNIKRDCNDRRDERRLEGKDSDEPLPLAFDVELFGGAGSFGKFLFSCRPRAVDSR